MFLKEKKVDPKLNQVGSEASKMGNIFEMDSVNIRVIKSDF